MVEKVVHIYKPAGRKIRLCLKYTITVGQLKLRSRMAPSILCSCHVISVWHLLDTLLSISGILGESIQPDLASFNCAFITYWLDYSS